MTQAPTPPLTAEELREAIKLLPAIKRIHIEHTITHLEAQIAFKDQTNATLQAKLEGEIIWKERLAAAEAKALPAGCVAVCEKYGETGCEYEAPGCCNRKACPLRQGEQK